MPLPTPTPKQSRDEFISSCMSSDIMNKEYPDKKQRSAVCYSQWKKGSGNKEMFCKVGGLNYKESVDDLIVEGYIATTHIDSNFDKISPDTLYRWADEINQGNPRTNKLSINHQRVPHVAGVAIAGSARVDDLPQGENGLYIKAVVDKTRDDFDDTLHRIEIGSLDSFSIEYVTTNPDGTPIPGATRMVNIDGHEVRMLLPNTELHGFTLASQPMNEYAVMLKELININGTINKEVNTMVEKKENPEDAGTEEPEESKQEETPQNEPSSEQEKSDSEELSKEEKEMLVKYREEKESSRIVESVLKSPRFKEAIDKLEIKEKTLINKGEPQLSLESKEFREIFEKDSKLSIGEQFRRASALAFKAGLITTDGHDSLSYHAPKSAKPEGMEVKTITNGTRLEIKGLGLTTNQNTDTDYLLSAAELRDLFDPVIVNALNEATVTWNVLQKDDYSQKGNNQVQFTLKTAANTTAAAYTGNSVTTGNTTRVKYMTKFKKYQVGVAVDGDMVAAARGGPVNDVFALEVQDSTESLLSVVNAALYAENGAETSAGVIGFEYITDSAGNTTLYNVTRSSSNKLAPDSAGDTYIDGGSSNITKALLRQAIRQCVKDGSNKNDLVFFCDPIQADKIRGIYDDAQRLVPTSSRFGFTGMIEFDGVPVFEDKDCNDDDIFLVDTKVHRIAIWVPPTLEMLGKRSDSDEGFIKMYFATYNRAPRRMVQIHSLSTS